MAQWLYDRALGSISSDKPATSAKVSAQTADVPATFDVARLLRSGRVLHCSLLK